MQNKSQTFCFFVGVDIGKSNFVATLMRESVQLATDSFEMSLSGLHAWLDWLASHELDPSMTLICLEHTGVYSEQFELLSYGAGYTLWKVAASRMRNIQLGPDRAKSDIIDSQKIASFCYRFRDQAQAFTPESQAISQIKQLIQFRNQQVKLRTALLNQQHSYDHKIHPMSFILDKRKESLAHFDQQIDQAEKEMAQILEREPVLKRMLQVLVSIPGIGPVTARKIIVVTQGFTTIKDHKKLAAHAGTAPFDNSSGNNTKWKKKRISHKADHKLKALLTTAVMSVIKKGGYFHQYYLILCNKPGRLKMQAINIIRNKLIKLAITLIHRDQLFDKDLFKNNCKSWSKNLILS